MQTMTETTKTKHHLLPDASVWGQSERPDGGLQLFLCGSGVTATAAGDRSDLDVELLGLLVIEVRVTGVKVVLLLLRAAYRERGWSRRTSSYCNEVMFGV